MGALGSNQHHPATGQIAGTRDVGAMATRGGCGLADTVPLKRIGHCEDDVGEFVALLCALVALYQWPVDRD